MRLTPLVLLVGLLAFFSFGSNPPAIHAQDATTPASICEQALPAEEPETRSYSQAEQVLADGVDYRAIFCTDAGAIYVDLYEDYTPVTVNNFVFLSQQGYYNNIIFHRVLEDFMAQGGDPTGTGTGGPGYQFQDEFVGFLHFDQPGQLAMANAGPGTNGSQFFITTTAPNWLNYQHTIFGEVLTGYDNVLNIQLRDPQAGGAATTLETVVIIEDPASVNADYEVLAAAEQDDVVAAFDGVLELVPPEAGFELSTDLVSTEDTVALAPESLQGNVETLLDQYGHEYRVNSRVVNATCEFTEIAFGELAYTLDAYASADDAAAALADPVLDAWLLDNGFSDITESTNIALPMRMMDTTLCEDTAASHGLATWQRGRFVITAEILIPSDNPNADFLDLWLDEIVGRQIYEFVLSDVLRPELRTE